MEKKTRLRRMALGILTLGSLLLVYPMLDIGSAKRTNAQTIDPVNMAKHNAPDDCWLAINNKVYNVTNFLSRHSGGASAIIPYCGKDATAAFSGKPHPGSDLAALSAYYIGDVGVVTPTPSPSPSPQPQPSPDVNPILAKIVISPGAANLGAGETEVFKAAAYDQNNRLMAGIAIVYSTSDLNVGSIDAGGVFTAKAPSSVLITASAGQFRSTAAVIAKEGQSVPSPVTSPILTPVSGADPSRERCEELYGNYRDYDFDDDSEDEADDKEDSGRPEARSIKNERGRLIM